MGDARKALTDLQEWVQRGIDLGMLANTAAKTPTAVRALEAVDAEIGRRLSVVPAQTDADPDLVDVGAEALGVKLLELGPVPKDPHAGLLRDLARVVLEAAADEARESAMVAAQVRHRAATGPLDVDAARSLLEHGGLPTGTLPGFGGDRG